MALIIKKNHEFLKGGIESCIQKYAKILLFVILAIKAYEIYNLRKKLNLNYILENIGYLLFLFLVYYIIIGFTELIATYKIQNGFKTAIKISEPETVIKKNIPTCGSCITILDNDSYNNQQCSTCGEKLERC